MAAKEISRKITESVVTGGFKKWFPALMASAFTKNDKGEMVQIEPAPVMPLYQVIGFVHGAKPGASEYGEFVKFTGQFRATNAADGAITDAPILILPNFLAEGLYAALQSPGRQGPIQVALAVGVRYDATALTKYVFVIHDLLPASEHDPLAMLAQSVASGQALLSAPAASPTPAPAPAAEPAPTPAPAKGKSK